MVTKLCVTATNQFLHERSSFWVILRTNRQTERQTDKRRAKYNLLAR